MEMGIEIAKIWCKWEDWWKAVISDESEYWESEQTTRIPDALLKEVDEKAPKFSVWYCIKLGWNRDISSLLNILKINNDSKNNKQ